MSQLELNPQPALRREPDGIVVAAQLQRETNAYWSAHLGDPGLLGGFQVDYVATKRDGTRLFVSTLYGGRRVIGSGHEIRQSSAAYVDSRKRGKAAA